MNTILSTLIGIFQTAFGSTFEIYFIGKQQVAAKSDVPSLCVYPISTDRKHSGTVRDTVLHKIGVEITVNFQKYLDSTTGQGTKLDTLEALVDFVEATDADGDLETDTVMGIINANLRISDKVLYTDDMQVSYEEYLDKARQPMCRVNLTFTAETRPNRT